MAHDFQDDLDAIASIDAIPTMLDVICRTTGMGFAAVARVTEDRWVVCQVRDSIDFGLKIGGELKIETTICNEIRDTREAVIIDNVAKDEKYCRHHTPAKYGFQSYISMPIRHRDGRFFGTLCAIDPQPAKLNNPAIIGMFALFAELIAAHLDSAEQLLQMRKALERERALKDMREQFIAVLGHDLRNPLAAIQAGAKMLHRKDVSGENRQVLSLMEGSVVRMAGLIDNVLDFAHTRMGGSLVMSDKASLPLQPVLEQVVAELRAVNTERRIETTFDAHAPVSADHLRLARLFSNLLGNALSHGAQNLPVRTGASTAGGEFEFWVANHGEPIADDILADLFQPFVRGKTTNRQGLGLGLYIASEIARLHDGTIDVSSTAAETRFTFRMPV